MSTKRLLVIESCSVCPNLTCFGADGRFKDVIMCEKMGHKELGVGTNIPIPDWCPLPKADPDHHEDPRGWVT